MAEGPSSRDVEPPMIIFPHAAQEKIRPEKFLKFWLSWHGVDGNLLQVGSGLPILARHSVFPKNSTSDQARGFDALCRKIVDETYINTKQASGVFFSINNNFFEKYTINNPSSGRELGWMRLRLDAWEGMNI